MCAERGVIGASLLVGQAGDRLSSDTPRNHPARGMGFDAHLYCGDGTPIARATERMPHWILSAQCTLHPPDHLQRNSCSRGRARAESFTLEALQRRSANTDARGHTRGMKLVASTCSPHMFA